MNTDIISAIKEDHKTLKSLYKIGLDKKSSLQDKKQIFRQLVIAVTAHSKSEEVVVYAPTCRDPDMKKDAYEGFEEHALVELLILEMQTEDNDDKWEAKFTVICHLLDHHIKEEEDYYLPKLKDMFDVEQRKEMAKEYNETFARLVKAQKSITEPELQPHMRNH